MALLSITPLASSSIFHELKPLRKTIPTLIGKCSTSSRRSVTPASITSMRMETAVSDDGVQGRVGNYHSNLWDDDFINSLISTPYEAPLYRERGETLLGEVKEIFNSISVEDARELITPLNDLIQRLWMVDSVERLGIDRLMFTDEIKSALDYVYSHWNEEGIGCGRESVATDLNSTALGLRTLRLHGYPVSSDVLEHFKDQKGSFACSSTQREGDHDIRSVFNLFRASLIAFPNEKVMDEAQIFSTTYLKEAVQKIPVSSLSRQIEYVMEYGWDTNLPRLEARHYIDVLGHDITMPYRNVEKLLELAKLEFNIFHSLQQRELKHLSRWWKDSGMSETTFTRHRHVEYYGWRGTERIPRDDVE